MRIASALFFFGGGAAAEMAAAMKAKPVFSCYRRVVYIILAVLVCVSIGYILKRYKGHPANGVVVYDLKWTGKMDDGSEVFHRWRYFIEAKTNLPRRIEKYYNLAPNDNYTLEETLVINYHDNAKLRQVIKDAGF